MAKFSFLSKKFKSSESEEAEEQKPIALVKAEPSQVGMPFPGLQDSFLSQKEKNELMRILEEFKDESSDIANDLDDLTSLTAEVKAINNQAAILHGERIKKAQKILKDYREGAFTAWLVTTYGNRQTPYNFLQYYDFYTSLPQILHDKLDEMPRQAVYTLASRTGSMEKKEEIVKNYEGQPKDELLALIRKSFPLAKEDKRASDLSKQALSTLERLKRLLTAGDFAPTALQKEELIALLDSLNHLVNERSLSNTSSHTLR